MDQIIYKISGINWTKFYNSLLIDDNSLKLSSKTCDTVEEFRRKWDKKLSLCDKLEINFEEITSIHKEENDENIKIIHNGSLWSASVKFSFKNHSDFDAFMEYFEGKLFFKKTISKMVPFKAIKSYLYPLALAIIVTVLSYFKAIAIENGTAEESHTRMGRLSEKNNHFFPDIIGLLGVNGVLIVGVGIVGFIGYTIWTRYKNPPVQISLER